MEKNTRNAYFQLHLSVFLWGFTAILGKWISVSALTLVWWRMLFTSISLLFLMRGVGLLRTIPRRLVFKYMGVGVIVALHWLAFYGAIKLANASVALVGQAMAAFAASLLEPLIRRTKIQWKDVGIGLLMVPGIALICNHLSFEMNTGLWVAILGAALGATFGIMNKMLIDQAHPYAITFLELGSGWLFLCLVLPIYFYFFPDTVFIPSPKDFFVIAFLAVCCTTVPYILSLFALRFVSTFTSMLIVNLEPVYGIALAWLLLNENKELNGQFYLGVAIILLAVFCYGGAKEK